MSGPSQSVYGVMNYLVPAAGQTHCVGVRGAPFTNQPYLVDWRQFKIDQFPFQPQGVIVDNSLAANPVTITINPIGYQIVIPAGANYHIPFPSPNGQTASITGGGGDDVTNIYFVDYPVLPFFFSPSQLSGAQDVIIAGVTDTTQQLPVSVQSEAQGGLPYRTQESVIAASYAYGAIVNGTNSVSLEPGAPNSNVRTVKLSLSGDATLAAAGDTSLTFTLNGNAIYARTLTLPAASAAVLGGLEWNVDFSDIGLNAGAAGELVVALSTGLATGTLDVNAYFTTQ